MVAHGVSECSVKKLLAKHLCGMASHSCAVSARSAQGLSNYRRQAPDDFRPEPQDDGKSPPMPKLIIKPDMLIKRRGKLGLVKQLDNWHSAIDAIEELSRNKYKIGKTEGYLTEWIIEPYIDHQVEFYICISSKRCHDVILFCEEGGVDVGDVESKARCLEIPYSPAEFIMSSEMSSILFDGLDFKTKKILVSFVTKLYNAYVKLHFQYMEINPFTIVDSNVYLLDCAAKADACARFLCKEAWKINDNCSLKFIPTFGKNLTETEEYIENLDSMTGASLKFTLINPKGRIWMLIAGGGASVVYADTVCDLGFAHELANYGEYSGAPKTHEIYEYVRSIFKLMLSDDQEIRPDGKILFIGGGIANFTNVALTFDGIIMALEEYRSKLLKHQVKIFVRRGGPNYAQGLKKISQAGERLSLDMKVYGPDVHMTSIVSIALKSEQPCYLEDIFTRNHIPSDNTESSQSTSSTIPFDSTKAKSYESSTMSALPNTDEQKDSIHKAKTLKKTLPEPLDLDRFLSADTYVFFFGFDKRAAQSMLDFDYKCGRPASVMAIVDPFQSEHREMFFIGDELIYLPVYKTIEKALKMHKQLNFCINMASMRSCYQVSCELIQKHSSQIKNIVIIAEGVPDNNTRHLICLAEKFSVNILGPSTVGAIKPGAVKLANTGGGSDQFTALKLYSPGSIGIVTKSGGLSSELSNIVARCTDGVFSCIAIGGDRYPCLQLTDCLMMYEKHPDCKIIVLIGEIGGDYELKIAELLRANSIKKPVLAWCIGTSAGLFKSDVQFGHAGAYAESFSETATEKNRILREAGAYVPESFDQIPRLLIEIYKKEILDGNLIPKAPKDSIPLPLDYSVAKSLGLIRKIPSMQTSICDERGTEVEYNNTPLNQILLQNHSIGMSIGSMWFKKDLPKWALSFIEFCITITADHGPCVSAAHNTIVASRAGKDLVSSVASGLLTIGSRFGGAMDQAAHDFYFANKEGMSPDLFVERKKKSGQRVMGIGHAVKSLYNPDSRVQFLVEYVNKNFPSHDVLDFAQNVSKVLLLRKHNLILNVDGAIGCAVVDMILSLPDMFSIDELEMLIENGLVNGFFVLSRTIGLIGHFLDQKRLNQGLYRHPWEDISKVDY